METTINGLTVIADPTMDRMSKRKVLRASAMALSTIQNLPFDKCPPVTVTLGENVTPQSGGWNGHRGDYRIFLNRYESIDKWRVRRGEDTLRHEFFHHYLESGGITYEQKCALFELSHGVAPNGSRTWPATEFEIPRYWPDYNERLTGAKRKDWFADYAGYNENRLAGEDWPYLLQEIYDGKDDGYINVARPNFNGRMESVLVTARSILE